jgi:hypothetical protein
MALLAWWARHPWVGWWLTTAGALLLLYRGAPPVVPLLLGAAACLSLAQGLRVVCSRSRVLAVLMGCLLAVAGSVIPVLGPPLAASLLVAVTVEIVDRRRRASGAGPRVEDGARESVGASRVMAYAGAAGVILVGLPMVHLAVQGYLLRKASGTVHRSILAGMGSREVFELALGVDPGVMVSANLCGPSGERGFLSYYGWSAPLHLRMQAPGGGGEEVKEYPDLAALLAAIDPAPVCESISMTFHRLGSAGLPYPGRASFTADLDASRRVRSVSLIRFWD